MPNTENDVSRTQDNWPGSTQEIGPYGSRHEGLHQALSGRGVGRTPEPPDTDAASPTLRPRLRRKWQCWPRRVPFQVCFPLVTYALLGLHLLRGDHGHQGGSSSRATCRPDLPRPRTLAPNLRGEGRRACTVLFGHQRGVEHRGPGGAAQARGRGSGGQSTAHPELPPEGAAGSSQSVPPPAVPSCTRTFPAKAGGPRGP